MIRRSEKPCKEGVCSIQCFPHTTRWCACLSDYAHTFRIQGYLYSGGMYFRGIATDSKFLWKLKGYLFSEGYLFTGFYGNTKKTPWLPETITYPRTIVEMKMDAPRSALRQRRWKTGSDRRRLHHMYSYLINTRLLMHRISLHKFYVINTASRCTRKSKSLNLWYPTFKIIEGP